MNSGSGNFSLYNRKFKVMIQILRLVYSPSTINMVSLQTCLQSNHDMSFSEPKREPIIGHCRSATKLNEKKNLTTILKCFFFIL